MNYGLRHHYYARNFGRAPLGQVDSITAWLAQRAATEAAANATAAAAQQQKTPGVTTSPGVITLPPPQSPGSWGYYPQAPGIQTRITSPTPIASDAAPAICMDESQNSIACNDPNCAIGDCGAPAGIQQITVGSLCVDQHENQIACNDPNCTFGDCTTSWFSQLNQSTIISGIPNFVIYLVALGALTSLLSPGGFGRRK